MTEQEIREGQKREASGYCLPVKFGPRDRGIVSFGPPPQKIVVAGKVYHFEWHHYFGPAQLTKSGDVRSMQPGPRSPFWDAVTAWHNQGCRVDSLGFAVWEAP